MQITRAAEYAIRGVLYLSLQPEGSVCLLNEISEKQDIPPSFLSKIFQNLARSGFVNSTRGTGGGFSLIKSPKDITLLDIVEAIDGQIALNVCLNAGSSCDNKPTCSVHAVWNDAQNYMIDLLKENTFAVLANKNRSLAQEISREPQPSD
jgi:Rrf2 family protein